METESRGRDFKVGQGSRASSRQSWDLPGSSVPLAGDITLLLQPEYRPAQPGHSSLRTLRPVPVPDRPRERAICLVEVLTLGRGRGTVALEGACSKNVPATSIFIGELLKLEFYPNMQFQMGPGNLYLQVL